MKKATKKSVYLCLLCILSVLVAGVTYAYLKSVFTTVKTATIKSPTISSVDGGTLSAEVAGGSATTDTARELPILTCNSYASASDCDNSATNYSWTTVTANGGDIDDLKISIIKNSNELDGAIVYLIKAFPNFQGNGMPEAVYGKYDNSQLTWHTNSDGKLESNEIDLGIDIPSGESVDVALNYYLDLTKMEQLAANNNLPDASQEVQIFVKYAGDTHAME